MIETSERAAKNSPNAVWVHAKLLRGLVIRSDIKEGRPTPILAIEVELISDLGKYRKGEIVRILNPDSYCIDFVAPATAKEGVINGFAELGDSSLAGFLVSNFRSHRNESTIRRRGNEAEWIKMKLGTYD